MQTKVLVLFSAFVLLGCQHSGTVIINPEYDESNTTSIQISKIELRDTATILFMDAYNRPNTWIRIASGSVLKGAQHRYKLIGSEGFDLDKEVYMPESGSVSFRLFFEPVDVQEKHIDFMEGESSGDFKISGIKLYTVKETKKAIQCVLKGEVVDRPHSSRLVLTRDGEDHRSIKAVYIPIRDGKFAYTLHCDAEESYELSFFDELMNGAWRPIPFISESGTMNFRLYSEDKADDNEIKGGPLNKERALITAKEHEGYKLLTDERDILVAEGRYYSKEEMELRGRIEELEMEDPAREGLIEKYQALRKEGKHLSEEGAAWNKKWVSLTEDMYEMKVQYARENPGIVGYTILIREMRLAMQYAEMPNAPVLDMITLVDLYTNIYKDKYPNHPYTAHVEKTLVGESVVVGMPYIDVVAENRDGQDVKLSDLIGGKVAMIHLWASWCGPCRWYGMELIPIYEQYKDRGFTVVGIARENNREAMMHARNQDAYPWQDLLELRDKNAIWMKYGIHNAAGGNFLVDAQGKILATSPTIEEVRKILGDIYKETK